jgi:hypothetical protein
MDFNKYIKKASDLVTSHEQTRAGFLSIALEKNKLGDPYVKNALAFKAMVKGTKTPRDLLNMPQVRPFLISASGLSDKSLNYLDETDRTLAIEELIKNFLEPAGDNYIDEAIYRYLLIKGDSVGGSMRNRIGALGEEKLIRCILSCMNVSGITYKWIENISGKFPCHDKTDDDTDIEKRMKALYWKNPDGKDRLLAFDMNISIVKKNVDINLFNASYDDFDKGKIASKADKAIMMGELKGGIDPAGADEHWKTANTALDRIRTSFAGTGHPIMTSFVGAAIEEAMAVEIYHQLTAGTMTNAANLTSNDQLVEYCNWLINL